MKCICKFNLQGYIFTFTYLMRFFVIKYAININNSVILTHNCQKNIFEHYNKYVIFASNKQRIPALNIQALDWNTKTSN